MQVHVLAREVGKRGNGKVRMGAAMRKERMAGNLHGHRLRAHALHDTQHLL